MRVVSLLCVVVVVVLAVLSVKSLSSPSLEARRAHLASKIIDSHNKKINSQQRQKLIWQAEEDLEVWRLIETGEGQRIWMQRKDILANLMGLPGKRSHFFDVTDYPTLGPENAPTAPSIPTKPQQQPVVDGLLPALKVANLQKTITDLSSFHTRYYTTKTGLDAAAYLNGKYKEFANSRSDIEVTYFNHTWLQPSVITRIQGTGPNADEVVILGGHEDSIYNGANGRAPGADDDASGSATVLEVFRVLAQSGFKPKRTIEFHAYAAEEVGLRGSQAIADAYKKKGVVVAGMMQLDMTGYLRKGTSPVISVIQDYVSLPLSRFVEVLVTTYSSLPKVTEKCGYACSDHASWYKAGYPASYPFESLEVNQNPYIHSPNDLLDRISLEHAIEIGYVALGFVVELALDV